MHDTPNYLDLLFVFMLATFIGLGVIRGVSRLLHTPLMSLTNAISAIAVVGSLIIAGEQKSDFATVLGTIAVAAGEALCFEPLRALVAQHSWPHQARGMRILPAQLGADLPYRAALCVADAGLRGESTR